MLVVATLVITDYVALLQLPRRVAKDTVQLALRENVQSLNASFREDRLELVEATKDFGRRPDVIAAVRDQDAIELRRLLDSSSLGGEILFQFITPQEIDGSGLGVITQPFQFTDREDGVLHSVVFYRPLTDAVLDEAASHAADPVSFALERDGSFVARSSNFPSDLRASTLDAPLDANESAFAAITSHGEKIHAYSRALTSDTAYQLHAVSAPELESAALDEVQGDVRWSIAAMSLATFIGFLVLLWFASRAVRSFATRARRLADGDYGTRLPVHGGDSFADLSASFNRLSAQLADQVGQLEDTAAAFGRTLETLEEGICVWDEEGTVAYWNRGAEQLTGLARERVGAGDPVIDFLQAERAPGTRRVTLPVRRSGSGMVVDLVVTAMPDGGVLQTFRDTTLLDSLQQTQRNFMATASHELRTPITTILGFADTLTNTELDLTDRQRIEFLSIIREQSHQLQAIAEAFFTNHQLANERVEVSITPTALDTVLADVLERLATSHPERAEEIDAIDVSIAPRVAALADRRALIGVLSVVVENAIKYGGPPIRIGVERKGGSVVVLVSDSGPGIEPYHQNRIFDPFYRIDVDMRSGIGGAGLGLFTARKLVEAMHGMIRVRSTPGAGTTFLVELPAVPQDETDVDEDDAGPDARLHLVG